MLLNDNAWRSRTPQRSRSQRLASLERLHRAGSRDSRSSTRSLACAQQHQSVEEQTQPRQQQPQQQLQHHHQLQQQPLQQQLQEQQQWLEVASVREAASEPAPKVPIPKRLPRQRHIGTQTATTTKQEHPKIEVGSLPRPPSTPPTASEILKADQMIKQEVRLRGLLLEPVALYNALQGVVLDDGEAVDGDVKEQLSSVVEQVEKRKMRQKEQTGSSGGQQLMKAEELGGQWQSKAEEGFSLRGEDQAEIVKGLASGDEECVSSDPYLQVLDDDE